ncbi:Leucine-rich repeat (LRR) protein [Geosmithia morbida]|uniref:Leucine-rich repeat (LRR) protein n=1 Tax=Geosmithia morbida TaxID=1094350 RepID=A0A9P4YVK8_9HYPO|nr:Leucine-rich repeat (LRR) protein [Geosmithia morbida]KAF4123645.1 Leucine-rich repeat (LRR) protein [Geosmithia morbida]
MDPIDRLTTAPGSMPPMTRGASDTTVTVNGRRPMPNFMANPNGPARTPTPPISSLRNNSTPGATLSASSGIPPSQVIALARESLKNSLENEKQVAEAGTVGAGLKPGVTIDLSRKNIQKIPEEVVDIVKNELERLALSHNQISSLPARFSECTSLRYLNIRANQIVDFPMPLCDLRSLEILDLGRNQLRALPPDIVRLSSLKVLSVRKNELRELPLCLADMASLQVLKFEGNPLVFPPRDALPNQTLSPPQDNEVTDVVMTAQVKRFLKQHMVSGRLDPEQNPADDSSEGAETPKVNLRRRVSGRFPVRVSGADLPDTRSPSTGRAPPIPQRSHYRGLSQQNTSTRRPGVMPLTLGNANERLRSNSETILRSERPESRNRRMGIVSKKGPDLGTVDETQANNRFSHYRGLSHGSAMQGAPVGPDGSPTPPDQYPQRPVYVRRLSILPERRRQSQVYFPVVEAAKGILYSVFQIHPMIQMLMSLSNDETTKRSSLEIVFYNTNSHVEELEREIQKHDYAVVRNDQAQRDTENVYRACQTLVGAYGHVCTLLADNADTFVDNGDPRYIRTLLMLIYNSIMELRVTMSTTTEPGSGPDPARRTSSDPDAFNQAGYTVRARPQAREVLPTPKTAIRPGATRSRNGTMMHNPANLRVATNVPVPAPLYPGGMQPDPMTASATPRSGESFASAMSREVPSEASEEDAQFDRIFLSLQKSADIVLRTLPNFNVQLSGRLRNAASRGAPNGVVQEYKALISMCNNTIQQTEVMRSRLSHIKLKEPGLRSQPGFWNLCSNFIVSWTNMAYRIWSVINTVPLPPDTRARLKPIQKTIKETSTTIVQSPWNHLVHTSGPRPLSDANNNGGSVNGLPLPPPLGGSATTMMPMSPSQITPQSAALGPAMQATMSKAPPQQLPQPQQQNGSLFAAAFHGNTP